MRIIINSFNYILVKYLSPDISSFAVTITRVFITSIIILIFFRKHLIWKRQHIIQSLYLAFLGVILNQTLFISGGSLTLPAHTSVIYSTLPLLIYIFSIILKEDFFSLNKIIGIIIAFSGIFFIMYEKGLNIKSDFLIGDIMIFTGAVSFSIYTVFGKRQKLFKSPETMTLNALFFGGVIYSLVGFPIFHKDFSLKILELKNISVIIYFAVFTSIISHVLWNKVVKDFDASIASLIQNLQIVVTTVFAMYLFDFSPGILFVFGTVLTFSGILIASKKTH